MAIRNSGANLLYMGTLPSLTTWSECVWCYPISLSTTHVTCISYRNTQNDAQDVAFGFDTTGSLAYMDNGSATAIGKQKIQDRTWYHMALVKNGSLYQYYINGNLEIEMSDATSISSIIRWCLFDVPTTAAQPPNAAAAANPFTGRLYDYRLWSGIALTSADLKKEMLSEFPVCKPGLFHWSRLRYATDINDQSQNANNWTVTIGSFTTEQSHQTAILPGRLRRSVFSLASGQSQAGAATLTCVSTTTGIAANAEGAAAAPTCVATVTASDIVSWYGVASPAAIATATAVAAVAESAIASPSAVATVTPVAAVAEGAVASLAAISTVAATDIVSWYGVAGLSAVSTVTAITADAENAIASLSAVSTVTAVSGVADAGIASATAVSTVTAIGANSEGAAAALTAIAIVTADDIVSWYGVAGLTAVSTVTANATSTGSGPSATLACVASVTALGIEALSGVASCGAVATVTAIGTVPGSDVAPIFFAPNATQRIDRRPVRPTIARMTIG